MYTLSRTAHERVDPYMFPGIRFDPREPPPPGLEPKMFHGNNGVQTRTIVANYVREASSVPSQPARPGPAHQDEHQLQQSSMLAPSSTTVNVEIVHDTAKITVIHLFRNQSSAIEQGTYQFPLPFEATVTKFNCRIGNDTVIHGKVATKEEAREKFDNARMRGQVGGLVEQQTAEIFTTSLANIPPYTQVRSELSYISLLQHRETSGNQVFTFNLPTFISPRYGDLPEGVCVANQKCDSLSINIDVLATDAIKDITSDTHSITWHQEMKKVCNTWEELVSGGNSSDMNTANDSRAAKVQLAHGLTFLDRDFVICIATTTPKGIELGQACLETHPVFPNTQALMLTLPHSLFSSESPRHDREIVFIADRSGSMEDKIERLKSAMVFFIKGIPEQLSFNIWCYGSNSASLWSQSKPLTDSTMQEAITYVRTEFAADMGGTEILPVIKKVQRSRDYKFASIDVIILTDGEVWHPEGTINYVREWRHASEGKARFFTLGIGQGVSHQLVQGIAKAGGGSCEIVTSDPAGAWEDRVVTLLKASRTDHISSISVDLKWEGDHVPQTKQSPADTTSISPFHRNRMYFLLDNSTSALPKLEQVVVNIMGTDGTENTITMNPKLLSPHNDIIHLLAVRSLLEDINSGDSWFQRAENGSSVTMDSIATDLAIRWSLISRWTSMYAVEEVAKLAEEDVTTTVEVADDDGQGQSDHFSHGNRNFLSLPLANTLSMNQNNGEANVACPTATDHILGAGTATGMSETAGLGSGTHQKRIGVASLLRRPFHSASRNPDDDTKGLRHRFSPYPAFNIPLPPPPVSSDGDFSIPTPPVVRARRQMSATYSGPSSSNFDSSITRSVQNSENMLTATWTDIRVLTESDPAASRDSIQEAEMAQETVSLGTNLSQTQKDSRTQVSFGSLEFYGPLPRKKKRTVASYDITPPMSRTWSGDDTQPYVQSLMTSSSSQGATDNLVRDTDKSEDEVSGKVSLSVQSEGVLDSDVTPVPSVPSVAASEAKHSPPQSCMERFLPEEHLCDKIVWNLDEDRDDEADTEYDDPRPSPGGPSLSLPPKPFAPPPAPAYDPYTSTAKLATTPAAIGTYPVSPETRYATPQGMFSKLRYGQPLAQRATPPDPWEHALPPPIKHHPWVPEPSVTEADTDITQKSQFDVFTIQDEASANTIITRILDLQKADGSFDPSQNIQSWLALSPRFSELFDKLQIRINELQVCATVAVVALLEVGYPQQSGFWALMVNKARDYLEKHGASHDVEAAMEEARKFVEEERAAAVKGSDVEESVVPLPEPAEELLTAPMV